MTVSDLKNLYDYSSWANQKLFHVIAQLPPQEFTRSIAGSYGSIRNTMVHTMSAEWGWLGRCGGPARGPRLNPDDYPTLASVVERGSSVDGHLREFLSGLKDDDLARTVEFANDRGDKRTMLLGELMHHAAGHGMHHRGQVAMLLRMLGHTPGDFDLLFYYAEKRGTIAW